jgi:hypothetical protein
MLEPIKIKSRAEAVLPEKVQEVVSKMKVKVAQDQLLVFPFEMIPVRGSLIIPTLDQRGKAPEFRTKKTDLPAEYYDDHVSIARVVAAGENKEGYQTGDLIAIDLNMAGASPFVYDGQGFFRIRAMQVILKYE